MRGPTFPGIFGTSHGYHVGYVLWFLSREVSSTTCRFEKQVVGFKIIFDWTIYVVGYIYRNELNLSFLCLTTTDSMKEYIHCYYTRNEIGLVQDINKSTKVDQVILLSASLEKPQSLSLVFHSLHHGIGIAFTFQSILKTKR